MKNIRRAIILFAVVVVAIQITPTHVFAADYLLPSSATVYLQIPAHLTTHSASN